MQFLRYQILWYVFLTALMLATQNVMSRKNKCDKKCLDILCETQRNPPPNTRVEIHTGYCKAKYVCRKGTDIRTCRKGQWIGSKALKCPAYCGKPANIPHATFSGSRFSFNSILKYRCDQGYVLKGPKRRKCRKNGQWSQAPTCSPNYTTCGVSPVDLRAKMVGGENSRRGWWPWQIGLRKINSKAELVLICGGALISRRWVLTAAQCFYHRGLHGARVLDDLSNKYQLTVGDHHLRRNEKSQSEVAVKKIFVHQDYVDNKITNDIALVKLDEEVKLGPFVRTLCIPEKDEGDLAIPKKYGIATGWGVTQALKFGEQPDHKKRYSDRLIYSAFTIQSDQLCVNKSAGFFVNSTVTFCAGDGRGGNDTCQGDSGGAFVREAKRGDDFRWVATGLISWGEGCAQKDKYGYYTRVYSFIDWIKKTMEDNS